MVIMGEVIKSEKMLTVLSKMGVLLSRFLLKLGWVKLRLNM